MSKRTRKTDEEIREAVDTVVNQDLSIRSAAKNFGISKSLLAVLVKKAKSAPGNEFVYNRNIGNRKTFSTGQEQLLVSYLKTTSKMCHGLTTTQTRELAYQFALANNISIPPEWNKNSKAGIHWLHGFMKRNKDLSLRQPENTSLSRASSFNKTNVGTFFSKLESLYKKYGFSANMIWNLDETGCMTVTKSPKVIAVRGSKQVGQIASAERGTLVTTLFFINAAGRSLPPVFVFPRVYFKDIMLKDAPTGSKGFTNPSGWITEDIFVESLKHFVNHVKPTSEDKALIIMDNHITHVNIQVIDFARENNIIILTLPPHCSHRMQPLDVAVYGPFKARYKVALNNWLVSNPGKTVSLYEVAGFVNVAYSESFSIHNICKSFLKTGLYPFNSSIFTENDFLASSVTDRQNPCNKETQEQDIQDKKSSDLPEVGGLDIVSQSTSNLNTSNSCKQTAKLNSTCLESFPSTSSDHSRPCCSKSVENLNRSITIQGRAELNLISPEVLRPYPKAMPRKSVQVNRKKGKSAVITDTPEKDELMKAFKEKAKKLKTNKGSQKAKVSAKKTKMNLKSPKVARTDYDSDTDISSEISLHDESPTPANLEEFCEEMEQKNKDDSCDGEGEKENSVCPICHGEYQNSKEEWLQCKLCTKWAHKSCGVLGKLHFFCYNCF